MPYEVKLNPSLRLIEIKFTGTLTSENIRKSTDEALALHFEDDVNSILIDDSGLEMVEDFFDLYDLPRQYAESGASRSVHIALVMPKPSEARKAAHFYSDVCFNRGWAVETFETREDAVAWLRSKEP